jgi:hypothetical protein
MSRRDLGLHLVLASWLLAMVSGNGRADYCLVRVDHDAPKCIHEAEASGPPCVTFTKVWCVDPWCDDPGPTFCEDPFEGLSRRWCPSSTEQGYYPSETIWFRNICPPSCPCSAWQGVNSGVNIFGGRIAEKKSCTSATTADCGGEGCESFNCGDTLCPGQVAVFKPTPTSREAANASEYDWIWHYWYIDEAPQQCEPSDGSWQLIADGHPWQWQEITNDSPCLVLSDPGRYRVKTYATFDGYVYECFDPPGEWCEVTVTDWGYSFPCDVIAVGQQVTLDVWMAPCWLNTGEVTLTVAGPGAVELSQGGQVANGSITWPAPNCAGTVSGGGTVDPIAQCEPDGSGVRLLQFLVKGVTPGEVTFTLSYADCESIEFKATVIRADINGMLSEEQEEQDGGMLVYVDNPNLSPVTLDLYA